MKNRIFSLVNKDNQSFIIQANSPEVALVKAQRMGNLGWSIVDELSVDELCYRLLKSVKDYDELTDEMRCYFKALLDDRLFDAFIHSDLIENLIGIREHDDIVKFVLENY